jgi:hypothetical protein
VACFCPLWGFAEIALANSVRPGAPWAGQCPSQGVPVAPRAPLTLSAADALLLAQVDLQEGPKEDKTDKEPPQEWFDDDFGLTSSRSEAEQLRLQQLQIEQEVCICYFVFQFDKKIISFKKLSV